MPHAKRSGTESTQMRTKVRNTGIKCLTRNVETDISRRRSMSVLVVNVIPEGIIFGADRLCQWTDGEHVGYGEGFKVLRWPNRRAVMGYVGMADLAGGAQNSTFEFLSDFIGEHHEFESLAVLAESLKDAVQIQYDSLELADDELLLIELAGFATMQNGIRVPQIWHITNAHGISTETGTYNAINNVFGVSDEFQNKYTAAQLANIRPVLRLEPYWMHQTMEFRLFNALAFSLEVFFALRLTHFGVNLLAEEPEIDVLNEFENRVRMKVLAYGGYNDSFESPVTRAVGLGCDILSLEWPE